MGKKIGEWRNQKIIYPGVVTHWGKQYVWLEDIDGTAYMIRLDEEGQPVFL